MLTKAEQHDIPWYHGEDFFKYYSLWNEEFLSSLHLNIKVLCTERVSQRLWCFLIQFPTHSCLQIYMIMLVVGKAYKLLSAKWAFILHEDFLFYNPIFSQLKIPLPYYHIWYFLGEIADPVILLQFFVPSFKYLMPLWLWKSGDSITV